MKATGMEFGIISWESSAKEIHELYISSVAKNFTNQAFLPKFLLGRKIFVILEMAISNVVSNAETGSVIKATDNNIRITTKFQCIDLYKAVDYTGRTWTANKLIKHFRIKKGYKLPNINPKRLNNLTHHYINYSSYEPYWVEVWRHAKALTILPFKQCRKKNGGSIHDYVTYVPHETLNKLCDITQVGQKTSAYVLLAIFFIYLYRINSYEGFTVFFCDPDIKQKSGALMPFFTKYLPLSIDFNEVDCFQDVFAYMERQVNIIKKQKTYACDMPLRYKGIMDKTNAITQCVEITNKIDNYKLPLGYTSAIVISEDGSKFRLFVRLDTRQDDNIFVFKNIASHIETLLNHVSSAPDDKLESLPILSDLEKRKILIDWNNTAVKYDKQKTIVDLFEEQVKVAPERIAVRHGNKHLTYEQLSKNANKLASFLRSKGAKDNMPIAIYTGRCLEMVIAIIGILKAGASYVPLDIDSPTERLKYILQDAQVPIILTQLALKHRFSDYTGAILMLEELGDLLDNEPKNDIINFSNSPKFNKLAYIIYTSGTTGLPKGVKITHGSLINHMLWMKDRFAFNQSDIILLKTLISFDASVWELFIPLIVGGELISAHPDAHRDPRLFIKSIIRYNVTTLQLVPSMLREFLRYERVKDCTSLRHVFVGGEMLSADIRKMFFKTLPVKLHNLYGPTEATIECTFHTCENSYSDLETNSIGKPINNTQVYVLDPKLQPLPIGIPGELFIGGNGLASGYLNNHGLTSEKFITNPFAARTNVKLYKTGDLVRWLPNGQIEYLGRLNDQVKIRGFRIELSEIEAHLLRYDYINQCAVIIVENRDNPERLHLIAYLSLRSKVDVNTSKLREFLRQTLPEYMIPGIFVVLDKLPLSANGKINKKALPKYEINKLSSGQLYVAPNTFEEKVLTDIWQQVLKNNYIGMNENFFDLDGNSLLALQILSLVKKRLSVEISIRDFFNFPTISQFSLAIRKAMNRDKIVNRQKIPFPIITLQASGQKTPLFLIHPVGGTIFWYATLAKYLTKERPIYGIQDPMIEAKTSLFSSIEEIADFYLLSIKKIQPSGPYIIGGASFGATVAVEITRKLQIEGKSSYFIPILDGWALYPEQLHNDDYFKNTMQRQHDVLRSQFLEKGIDGDSLFKLQWNHLLLLWDYKMQPIKQKIILFKAQQLLPEYETVNNPLNYWDKYASDINLYLIPGNHETIFHKPNVKVLAEQFNKCLTEFAD